VHYKSFMHLRVLCIKNRSVLDSNWNFNPTVIERSVKTYVMKMYGGVEVYLNTLLARTSVESGQHYAPGSFVHGEKQT
jgi:hypothetical protein